MWYRDMKIKFILIPVLLAVVLFAGYWFVLRPGSSAEYQAVFLSNGQVYFGNLNRKPFAYPVLTDVYYLILRRPLQQQTAEGQEQQQETNYTLVKLGKEMHGPQDKMLINPKHILFVEDLKADGKVVQAIQQYKQNPQE